MMLQFTKTSNGEFIWIASQHIVAIFPTEYCSGSTPPVKATAVATCIFDGMVYYVREQPEQIAKWINEVDRVELI